MAAALAPPRGGSGSPPAADTEAPAQHPPCAASSYSPSTRSYVLSNVKNDYLSLLPVHGWAFMIAEMNTVLIPNGAHHRYLGLFFSNPADSPDVIAARKLELEIIAKCHLIK